MGGCRIQSERYGRNAELTDAVFAEIINAIRRRTALPAWLAEFLAAFVVFISGRFVIEALLLQTAGASAGVGIDAAWWVKWVYAYDQLRSFADDAAVAGLVFAIVVEGGIMFLARKRIRLSRVEGREEGRAEGLKEGREEALKEGREKGRKEGREEAAAAAAARIAELEALLAERRNAAPPASPAVDPAQVAELEARVRELERRSNGNSAA